MHESVEVMKSRYRERRQKEREERRTRLVAAREEWHAQRASERAVKLADRKIRHELIAKIKESASELLERLGELEPPYGEMIPRFSLVVPGRVIGALVQIRMSYDSNGLLVYYYMDDKLNIRRRRSMGYRCKIIKLKKISQDELRLILGYIDSFGSHQSIL